ncbi:MAG TPA: cache domain-containing protein, partial [Anaerolineales bacterium]|nr:cache domain-containing protein [Anaerolineales bacterium]
MVIDFTPLGNPFFITEPQGTIGWMGWFILLAISVILIIRWRKLNKRWTRIQGGIFISLLILLFLSNLFFVVRFPNLQTLLPAAQVIKLSGLVVPVLAASSWVLAAGLLGVFPAAAFGVLSGVLIALFYTHNPFTVMEYGLLGIVLAGSFHQHYRTWVFRLLRRPLFSSTLFSLAYPLLYILDVTVNTQGTLAGRLDVALSQVEAASISVAMQLLVAGVIGEVVAVLFPRLWGFTGPLEPSPVERRLQSRFLSSLAPLAFILVVGLMAGDWIAAGRAATNMVNDRLESSGKMAANTVPSFLEMGQNLIQILAKNPTWVKGTLSEKNILLGDNLRTIPYFSEFYLLDVNGQSVTGYPTDDFYAASPSMEEYMGITLALNGMPIQMYTLPPSLGGMAARLSFLTAVYDDKGVRSGVLVGRT